MIKLRLLPNRRRIRGQGLVEFALVLPIFLFILFALIDMGRYVYLNSTLSQAAREGARVASVEASHLGTGGTDASCGSAEGPVCPANPSALATDVLNATNRMMTPFAAIATTDLSFVCDTGPTSPVPANTRTCSDGDPGNYVSVNVKSTFRPITPVISSIFPSINTQASASMVIN